MTGSDAAEQSYIRGSGGVTLDGRRVGHAIVVLAMLSLAVLGVIFLVIAVQRNARITALKQHGVPVQVTVTGCVGLASGTGITEAGFVCRGDFVLSGRHYNSPIGGTADLLTVGRELPGIVLRNQPSVLYTARSVSTMRSSWMAYITPVALLTALAAAEPFRRRLRSSYPTGTSS